MSTTKTNIFDSTVRIDKFWVGWNAFFLLYNVFFAFVSSFYVLHIVLAVVMAALLVVSVYQLNAALRMRRAYENSAGIEW